MQRIQILSRRLAVLASLTVASLSLSSVAIAECLNDNTCYGTQALFSNIDGDRNSAFGYRALFNNTGSDNTAIGNESLFFNINGSRNTASGSLALYSNTTGHENTAIGNNSLFHNTEGDYNTAIGKSSLYYNITGFNNTAGGYSALHFNTEGTHNTAIGSYALEVNSTGLYNTGIGAWVLTNNTTGSRNTADGAAALYNATGSRNVALGYYAGYNITGGSDNIIIGAGQKGRVGDSGVIRIGASTLQSKAFIAGIRGVTTGRANAVPVVVDANGQLGTVSSSRLAKVDIHPMGNLSERLLDLQPVTFRYKQAYEDGSKPVQFGLIAEEVAESFPELVILDESGRPETVAYHMLPALLLNELQKEHELNQAQSEKLSMQEKLLAEQALQLAELNALRGELGRVKELLVALQSQNASAQLATK